MNNKVKKVRNVIVRNLLKPLIYINGELYTKYMTKFLRKNGMNILGNPFYLSSSISFDGTDYGLITLEDGVSISKDVMFLTHDFSMNTVYQGMDLANKRELEQQYKENRLLVTKPIRVGAHSFIGAKVSILPGCDIGKNCLIGAGSVCRGKYPDNSIVMGNPAKVVKKTSDWLEQQTQ